MYAVPRLQEPVWLSLTTFPDRRSSVAVIFIREFCQCVDSMDTKARHHFFRYYYLRCSNVISHTVSYSTLITAVLAHHLAWITTVTPEPHSSTSANKGDKETTTTSSTTATTTTSAAGDTAASTCNPYNALWAQLMDLYGCLGTPPHVLIAKGFFSFSFGLA